MEKKKYSQWKAMLAISRASFRSITRNPSAVIFSLVFPLIFILVFGFINGNRIGMDVGIVPGSDTSGMVYRTIRFAPNINFEKNISREQMQERLDKGRLDAIIEFKLSKKDTGVEIVSLITSKASKEKGTFLQSILNNIIDKQNLRYYKSKIVSSPLAGADYSLPRAELRPELSEGREYKMIDFILPGQLGFSILSAGVFGTAFVFFSLRQTLVLKRFFATPIRRTYIILGETFSRLVFQMIGSLIIILIGHFVFGFTLIHGIVTVIEMLLLSMLGLIVFMGFGFVVSGIAKTENVIPPIANIVTLPQFLLSGTFFPIDAFPKWLQYISKALPLTYLNDALRMIAFEGAGFPDISTQILIIIIWGIVIYAAAVKFFRWE